MLAGCAGPPAPDAAVCRDYLHRLCLAPRCVVVDATLAPGDACEEALLERSGCADDSFTFATIGRSRFLECRAPLLRAGDATEAHPDCDDVAQSFSRCPEVVEFLRSPQ